jgi:hypothetical protein
MGVWQFSLVADAEAARYDLLIEPSRPGDPSQDIGTFGGVFDQALMDVNVEYGSKRRSQRLGPPRLFVMRPGWSERVCRAEVASGRRESQHKWSALRPEWDEASRRDVLYRVDAAGSAERVS